MGAAVLWRRTTRGRQTPRFVHNWKPTLSTPSSFPPFVIQQRLSNARRNGSEFYFDSHSKSCVSLLLLYCAFYLFNRPYSRWATSCRWRSGRMTSCFGGWLQQTAKLEFWHGERIIRYEKDRRESPLTELFLTVCVQHKLLYTGQLSSHSHCVPVIEGNTESNSCC